MAQISTPGRVMVKPLLTFARIPISKRGFWSSKSKGCNSDNLGCGERVRPRQGPNPYGGHPWERRWTRRNEMFKTKICISFSLSTVKRLVHIYMPRCGNLRIFLPLIFYVKINSANLKTKKWLFIKILEALMLAFVNFPFFVLRAKIVIQSLWKRQKMAIFWDPL